MVNTWVFQANPKVYRVEIALKTLTEHTWLTNQHAKEIAAGDEVFIWRCGEEPAIVAIGTVLTDPTMLEAPDVEKSLEVEPLKFDGKRMRVKVRTQRIDPPVPRYQLLKIPELAGIAVFKGCIGTNFRIGSDAAAKIRALIEHRIAT